MCGREREKTIRWPMGIAVNVENLLRKMQAEERGGRRERKRETGREREKAALQSLFVVRE